MSKKLTKEMAMGGVAGFQAPMGWDDVKESLNETIRLNPDINHAQLFVFLSGLNGPAASVVNEALRAEKFSFVADLIRESVVRQAIRTKIREVVRKKAGGGGYTLYSPNKGKKHNAQPVATFPTRLGAKRAELARFPPKDPKKLQRLRKEIDKMLKNPKKAADAENRARRAKTTHHQHHHVGHGRTGPRHFESKIISKIVVNEIRRRVFSEGLFREEAQDSQWDEFIKKISDQTVESDRGFQRVMKKLDAEMNNTLNQSLKIIQKQLGANAKVKAMGVKKTDDGRTYMGFQIESDNADVGPVYVYSNNGVPRIELSDSAKASFSKISPGTATAIRGALATAEDALERSGGLQDLISQRDQYLSGLEGRIDKSISELSPLGLALAKRLLVKKYRGSK